MRLLFVLPDLLDVSMCQQTLRAALVISPSSYTRRPKIVELNSMFVKPIDFIHVSRLFLALNFLPCQTLIADICIRMPILQEVSDDVVV